MLAYVFWHWRREQVSAAAYEELTRGFHEALSESPAPGLLRSTTLAIAGAPWANGGGEAYEDWYLVRNSADLDGLNDAAVSNMRQMPHDAVAAAAGGGTAGLYRLRRGDATTLPRHAYWFSKPEAMRYGDLFAALDLLCQDGCALWGRQMTLGPAAEFCLHSARPVALPSPLSGRQIDLRKVYPRGTA